MLTMFTLNKVLEGDVSSPKSLRCNENDHIESLTGTLCATTRQERGSHANSINRDQLTWVIKVIVEEAL